MNNTSYDIHGNTILRTLMCGLLLLSATPTISAAESNNTAADTSILNPDDDPRLNINLGFSLQDGLISVEYQSGHHSVSFGPPVILAYRYYTDPYDDTKFYGAFAGNFGYTTTNTTYNGLAYQDMAMSYAGVLAGYRWQWASGWNVSLSIALTHIQFKYSNPAPAARTAKEQGIVPFPGLTAGYKF